MTLQDIPSELSGKVWKIHVEVGSQIEAESPLMTLECMKMEIPVLAPKSGTVAEILVAEEDLMEEGQILARISTSG